MRFLIDANMPRSTAESLRRCDHEAVDVRDIGMGGAADSDIAPYAEQNRLALVTRDLDFADIRNYPPAQYASRLAYAATAGGLTMSQPTRTTCPPRLRYTRMPFLTVLRYW
jgi:hypothetical protein